MSVRLETIQFWVSSNKQLVTVAVSGALIFSAWISAWAQPGATAYYWLMIAGALVAGTQVAKEAWARLAAGQFSIPLLVTIAAVGAVWIGEVWEAAAVTFLYVFGGYLESLTLARTREALKSLVDMAPRIARVKRQTTRAKAAPDVASKQTFSGQAVAPEHTGEEPSQALQGATDGGKEPVETGIEKGRLGMRVGANGSEEIVIIPAVQVQAGDIVVVLPGDRVPVDGKVIAGRASLDTAALTGEPLPVEVGEGDSVLGGSVSMGGYLEVVAERVGPDTTFSKLIYLVAEAQEQKPKVQKLLDRFARWYTPLVIALAVVLYAVTREPELALTFLVIGCPGALVVASPVAVVAGLGKAARKGILIKGGERLERISSVDVVAFDKTGTLTLGKPRVSSVIAFEDGTLGHGAGGSQASDESHTAIYLDGASRVLSYAAAAEQRSEHHLANAILTYVQEQKVYPVKAWDWQLEAGLGVAAQSDDGEILVGNRKLLESRGIQLPGHAQTVVKQLEAQGQTIALVAVGGNPLGVIAIEDPVRPEALGLVQSLKQAGVKQTVMLTGDNPGSAARVASQLGIDVVKAGLLPEQKVQAIRGLQSQGHVVAMVGDGVNDAPALAVADVSIAMGASGTQAAIETADIALMADRLERVPYSIRLSGDILKIVRQNVVFAVAVVVLLLAGVIGRVIFLSSGMLVHEASILLVIANGMRLLRPDE